MNIRTIPQNPPRRKRQSLLSLCLALLLLPATLPAEEKKPESASARLNPIPAGHSYHGEEFNEGPRQRAVLIGGTGRVHLPITTKHPEVQAFFDQGVGQLHGFWYFEAERSFRHAAALDPQCAMAYWGMALANYSNLKRARGFIKKAMDRRRNASARERRWIELLHRFLTSQADNRQRWSRLIRDLDALAVDYPQELEAKAFLAWAIWAGRNATPIQSYVAADRVIQQVLDANPFHPVHHYRIHLWDYRRPQNALASAARCGQSAPAIAHMWHMPGHIYWRLRRYHDAAWHQEASARVDHAHMIRRRVMPYQIFNYAHNNEWLTRTLSKLGRARDALALAKNMLELPRHPSKNRLETPGSGAYYGQRRTLEVLERFEMWQEVLHLCHSSYLQDEGSTEQRARRWRALGIAYLELGQTEQFQQVIQELEKLDQQLQQQLQQELDRLRRQSSGKKKKDGQATKQQQRQLRRRFQGRRRWVTQALGELRLRHTLQQGKLTAEQLKQLERYRAIPREHLARLMLRAGQPKRAEQLARAAASADPQDAVAQATLVEVLFALDKQEEAARAFRHLQQVAHSADLDVAPFNRITALAPKLGSWHNWPLPYLVPQDILQRPQLSQLGPFRWFPTQAPPWTLPDDQGRKVSLSDYRGRPVIVIFYLGYGCLHCAEQLEKFAPMTQQFAKEGIQLVAISTDTVENLRKSHERYASKEDTGHRFPFPLVADPQLRVFRRYRCYDDFEKLALHGTFLIDAQGRVRWQDISYEPFMEAEFLLREAKRLLAQPVVLPKDWHIRPSWLLSSE